MCWIPREARARRTHHKTSLFTVLRHTETENSKNTILFASPARMTTLTCFDNPAAGFQKKVSSQGPACGTAAAPPRQLLRPQHSQSAPNLIIYMKSSHRPHKTSLFTCFRQLDTPQSSRNLIIYMLSSTFHTCHKTSIFTCFRTLPHNTIIYMLLCMPSCLDVVSVAAGPQT